jgi:hypothetical protein
MGLGTAFRAFFAALGKGDRAQAIRRILDGGEAVGRLERPVDSADEGRGGRMVPERKASLRSDAIAVLATLQREARFVDLVQESLDGFSDAQIGAAARPCLKQCRDSLERIFALVPASEVPEGGMISLPEKRSPIRFQTVGDRAVSGQGRVVHPGWLASSCKLPQYLGDTEDALVVAPIQVEAT